MLKICCLYNFNYLNITDDPGATIYVDINSMSFPDDEWYDLPLSVLDMWCWNLIENFEPLNAEFSLCFMDGPYFIRCLKDNDNVKMYFIDNHGDDEQILIECMVTFNELINVIYEAANELVLTLISHKVTGLLRLSSMKRRLKTMKKLINGFSVSQM